MEVGVGCHEPSPRRNVALEGVPLPSCASGTNPDVMSVPAWVWTSGANEPTPGSCQVPSLRRNVVPSIVPVPSRDGLRMPLVICDAGWLWIAVANDAGA